MNNLLRFLVRFSHFFLFLGLEAVAFVLIFTNNSFQKSAFLASSNAMAASIYTATDYVNAYFGLRGENQRLAEENTALLNQLQQLENELALAQEGVAYQLVDSLPEPYVFADKDLTYISARVVHATTNRQHNYLTINKGRRDGVLPNMGVINEEGVVGIVCAASERFAVVISLLHTDLAVSSKFKHNKYVGTIHWTGADIQQVNMLDVARHVDVHQGDTILTSGLSSIFPPDILVGTVAETDLTDNDAFYHIDVKLAVSFKQLHYVKVIANHNQQEQVALQDSVYLQ